MKDLKYLCAYLMPLVTIFSIYKGGYYSYGTVIFAFGILPVIEQLLPFRLENLDDHEIAYKIDNRFFDWLLYLNIPIVYGILLYFLVTLGSHQLNAISLLGLILSVGILFSTSGINVAHELGHKDQKYKQFMSKVLLLPSLYLHFFIEHNLGHHKNVATEEDPASARKGELIYTFWFRSLWYSYFSAWTIEKRRLAKLGQPTFSISNAMLQYAIIQLAFLGVIFYFYGFMVVLIVMATALVSVLLLESINYIEHYGLRRKKLANGRYERVQAIHSWNSNHELGRIMLYELTRHSDHHFISNKKYQLLDTHEAAPQLPFGYPGSILLSLVPPLWFKIIDSRIENKYAY